MAYAGDSAGSTGETGRVEGPWLLCVCATVGLHHPGFLSFSKHTRKPLSTAASVQQISQGGLWRLLLLRSAAVSAAAATAVSEPDTGVAHSG